MLANKPRGCWWITQGRAAADRQIWWAPAQGDDADLSLWSTNHEAAWSKRVGPTSHSKTFWPRHIHPPIFQLGELLNMWVSVFVKKKQTIHMTTTGYNRNLSVWQFQRWLTFRHGRLQGFQGPEPETGVGRLGLHAEFLLPCLHQ